MGTDGAAAEGRLQRGDAAEEGGNDWLGLRFAEMVELLKEMLRRAALGLPVVVVVE